MNLNQTERHDIFDIFDIFDIIDLCVTMARKERRRQSLWDKHGSYVPLKTRATSDVAISRWERREATLRTIVRFVDGTTIKDGTTQG